MCKLRIALQKNGRLSQKSIELLQECGIRFPNGSGKLLTESSNFPLEILFLRDDDIPQYVEQQVADIGIIGENVLMENPKDILTVKKLGFSACRLSLAVPKETEYCGPDFFRNKRIATSYPRILKDYFEKRGIEATIELISGSVEIAPGIGLADAVFDIVSSGSTLLSNGLREVEKVADSEAVLIASCSLDTERKTLLDKLLLRMQAVQKAAAHKYILLNAPNNRLKSIQQLLPGMKSPTVLPLAENGWSSLHSVIPEDDFWNVIDALQNAGAEGILVVPIEKMIL